MHRLGPLKRHTKATYGCKAAPVKVRYRGLGLLRPRLNAGPTFDDSGAQGGVCANAALYKRILLFSIQVQPIFFTHVFLPFPYLPIIVLIVY